MTDTLYRIITCTRDEGSDWERSSEVVAIGDAEAEAAWDAAFDAMRPRSYEQCITLVSGTRVIREHVERAIDVLPAAVAKLRGERVNNMIVYYDDASQAYYVCDLVDASDLGERLIDDVDGTAYSRWCADTAPLGEGDTADKALASAGVER